MRYNLHPTPAEAKSLGQVEGAWETSAWYADDSHAQGLGDCGADDPETVGLFISDVTHGLAWAGPRTQ